MAKQKPKVLFFIAGFAPTEAELEASREFEANNGRVCFRQARFVREDESAEEFDIVAGLVPAIYKAAAALKSDEPVIDTPKSDAAAVPPESPFAPATAAPGTKTAKPKPNAAAAWAPNA